MYLYYMSSRYICIYILYISSLPYLVKHYIPGGSILPGDVCVSPGVDVAGDGAGGGAAGCLQPAARFQTLQAHAAGCAASGQPPQRGATTLRKSLELADRRCHPFFTKEQTFSISLQPERESSPFPHCCHTAMAQTNIIPHPIYPPPTPCSLAPSCTHMHGCVPKSPSRATHAGHAARLRPGLQARYASEAG